MGEVPTTLTDRRPGSKLEVAWLHPVLAHYRLPVIERLSRSQLVDLRTYVGQGVEGIGVSDASADLSSPVERLRNIHLTRRGRDPRVLYVSGWTRVLAGRPQVVITTEASHNLVNWLLLATRRRWGHRVVIMGHIRSSGQGRVAMGLRRRLVTAADGVLAYTNEGAEKAVAWGVPRERIAALGNTLDLSRIEAARHAVQKQETASLRSALNLNGLVCLFVGRPNRVKRLDLAIDAMRLLTQRNVSAHLIVVGSSAELPTHAERARGMANVHFIGEILDEDRLAPYFAVADVAVIPGAVGLSVNHAFAYGLPLVTSANAPHRPEMSIAEHGRNALLVRPMEAAALADALEQLAVNPALLQELKAGVAATAVPGIDAMVAAIETLVVEVARQSPKHLKR